MKSIIFFILIFFVSSPSRVYSQERNENMHISYIREVNNQLYLSDFELGSSETIKDTEGHGIAIGWFFANEGDKFFLLDMGYSKTRYNGTVEDGVSVSFSPKAGTGYDAVSESKNIIYDVDLEFDNPYIGISYTNWEFAMDAWFHTNIPVPVTWGVGIINQTARGDVKISTTEGVDIAEASYKSALQRYYLVGISFNVEFIYFSLVLRHVTSPELEVTSCNEDAIGNDACDRFYAANGNRNNAPVIFTGGVLSVGIMF